MKVVHTEDDTYTVPDLKDKGKISDGYHTFNELYEHRLHLTACLCNSMPGFCYKSKLHDDGTMFDGMFIVSINFKNIEQITYHYDIKDWDMFKIKELDKALPWDGHTSSDVLERLKKMNTLIHKGRKSGYAYKK